MARCTDSDNDMDLEGPIEGLQLKRMTAGPELGFAQCVE
jgi:hypothetical protein